MKRVEWCARQGNCLVRDLEQSANSVLEQEPLSVTAAAWSVDTSGGSPSLQGLVGQMGSLDFVLRRPDTALAGLEVWVLGGCRA